jgi:pyruvate,orthophosphate dikinase
MPLLVSVRSGARDSMPGMMDTILNLGLNDQTVLALVAATKNERFAWDCYRRFVQMYGDVVMGVQKTQGEDHEPFEVVIGGFKHEKYHAPTSKTRSSPPTTSKELVNASRRSSRSAPARNSRNDPWKQLRAPSAPCSAPG